MDAGRRLRSDAGDRGDFLLRPVDAAKLLENGSRPVLVNCSSDRASDAPIPGSSVRAWLPSNATISCTGRSIARIVSAAVR